MINGVADFNEICFKQLNILSDGNPNSYFIAGNLQTKMFFPNRYFPSPFKPTFYQSNLISSVSQIPYLKFWDIFWLNHVLLFLILDVDTQVNKHYFSICNENAPQHTDIVWKDLALQTRTWKWTAVLIFAISCISNSSSKSNNSSNNVITAINNRSDINNFVLQRKGHIGQK